MQEVIEGFHLSPQQEHLWLLQHDKNVYLAYCSIMLEGPLDIHALQASVQAVIDQNEIYRTYLRHVPGMKIPLQIVAEKGLFVWRYIDLGLCHTQEQALKVQEISEQEKLCPIDCERGPLLHVSLIALSNNTYILLVHTLALYADWRSLQLFMHKIALFYGQNQVDEIVQYVQFSEWQNSMLEDEIGRKGKEQWRKQDLPDLFVGSLPGKYKSAEPLSFSPAVLTFPLEYSLQKKLYNVVERYRTSVDRFLFVCWKILLWKLMGRRELCIGLGVDERVYGELAETSGPLTKYVPLFYHLDENQRFADVLKHIGNTIEAAVEWQQSFSWEDVMHASVMAGTTFFPLSFDFNALPSACISNNVSFELQSVYACQEPFEVKLTVIQKAHALSIEFHYDTNIFQADDIQRLAEQFWTCVENAVDQPEAAIDTLDILSKRARDQILLEFNNTQADSPQDACVHLLFEEQVACTPNKLAVLDEKQQYSYLELNQRANQLSHYLQELGVGADVVVGVIMERSTDVLVAILGILKAGGAYVPLDQLYPPERLAFIMAETHMPVLLTQQHLVKNFSSTVHLVSIDNDWPMIAQRNGENAPACRVTADNLAYVMYTSGSTGTPKGVMIPHGGLVNYLTWCIAYYRVAEGCGSIVHSSIAFDLTITSLFSPLLVGKSVVMVREDQSVEALARTLQGDHDFSMLKITPAHLGVLNTYLSAHEFVDKVRTMVIGGEALLAGHLTSWRRYAPNTRLINEYGPTETVVGCCVYEVPVGQQISENVPIGRPIANTQLYILDDHLRPLPIGVPGELYIGGSGLARGYYHRPDLTAERFIPNAWSMQPGTRLYKTGDLACYLPDGTIEYLGRLDHQVKIRGYRIELEEIEAVLLLHPDVHECVVLAREDVSGDKQLVAYVGADLRTRSFQKVLRDYLQEKLPKYMLPSLFVVLDVLPLTPNGKVDRQALPVPESRGDRSNESIAVPLTPVEDMVKTIWEKVLRLEQIGIHENFFEIGGHSLLATQIGSRLRSTFHIDIEVSSIFDAPTIARLAHKVEETLRRESGLQMPPLVPVSRAQDLPVSFAQQRLWFFDQLVPHSSFYTIANAGRLSGALNVDALEWSLKEMVQRHEVLRTIFQTKEGRPVQVIQPASCKLCRVDLSQLSSEWNERETRRFIEDEVALPFDLAHGPLLRSTLLYIRPQEYVFLLTMHHIVSDGWSSGIFFRELATLYRAFAAGEPSPLLPLSIHYADFAVWQRQWLDGSVLEKHIAYWRERLRGAPPLLELPTDRPRASIYNGQVASQEICLPVSLVTSIKSLSCQQDATLFMTLLTVLNIVLFRWTGQADTIVGTVVANRTQVETEQLIGCFMNFLALRSQMTGEQRAFALLAQIRAMVLEAYAHQDCPFDKLVEVLQPDRTRYHNPFYNVAFLLQNIPGEDPMHEELQVSSLSPVTQSALLDLRFVASETPDGLTLSCEYDRALFDAETIEELLSFYLQVVDALVQEPDKELVSFTPSAALTEQVVLALRRDHSEMIAIAASFTAEPVEESLAYWLQEFDLSTRIRFAPYHQVFQQLLDPTSVFASNQTGVNVILFRFEDWQRTEPGRKRGELDQERIEHQLAEFVHMLQAAVHRARVPYLVCVCPASTVEEPLAEVQRAAFLARMEDRLAAKVAEVSGCFLITSAEMQAMYPVTNFYDPYGEKEGHLPFTSSFFAALGTMLARKITALRRAPYKVIVVDGDQTLWSGVVGEDGAHGVVIAPSNIALQKFLVGQQAQGMLLCVCSKNQEQDVLEVFTHHSEMPLQCEHVVAWRVNWEPKSENLCSLAEELDLSLESFILLDDNPLECAEVQANCPEVLTLLLPQDLDHFSHILQHLWVFDHMQVTTEDKLRTSLYVQQRQRQAWQKEAPTLETFLAALELQVEITPLKETQLDRVSQLTQRTNQFNCTTRRRTTSELQQFCQQGGTCLVVEVRDRFGEYGVAGVLLFQNERTGFLEVDTFLLSCRVMGRGVEHQMLARLGAIALEQGLSRVHVPFIASAKNTPAIDFLAAVGKPFKQMHGETCLFDFSAEIIATLKYKPLARLADTDEAGLSRTPQVSSKVETRVRRADSSQFLHIATNVSTVEQIIQVLDAQRSRLPEHHHAVVAPRTEIEGQLVEIWQSLLGLRHVSIHANFFEVGGHSLLATQLLSRVVEVLHVEVPLRSLFEAPTIAGLAQEVERASHCEQGGQIPALRCVARDQPLPLSFAQQRLWFLDQLEPGLSTYIMPLAVRLSGSLDLAALLKSLHEIVRRHESLRTAFRWQDDQPVQLILPASVFRVRVVLLDAVPALEREAQVQALVQQEARHPFDLACGPLLRATVLCLKPHECVLLLTLHHIASDGWSEGILREELFTLYRAFMAGEPSPLPVLPFQYADFAVWQRQWLQGEVLEQQQDYWRSHLVEVPALELPLDHARPAVQTFAGASRLLILPLALQQELQALSQRYGVTLFMLLLSAFQILLARCSGQDDFAIGTPVAQRTRNGIEGLIGFFVNTLVIRGDLSGDPTFPEHVRRVREACLGAYDHQDVPFEKLVEVLQPERDLSRSPLFQVLFVLQQVPVIARTLPGLQVCELDREHDTARFDLTLEVVPVATGLRCKVEYNRVLFEPETIGWLLLHWQVLLGGIVAQPNQRVSTLPLLSQDERKQLLSQWDTTWQPAPGEQSLHMLCQQQAERTPDRVALVFEQTQVSYGCLDALASSLARRLRRLGCQPDQLVGICMERSLELVIGLIAILKAAGAYVPLDPAYPPERIQYMLQDSQTSMVLIQPELHGLFEEAETMVMAVDMQELQSDNAVDQEGPCVDAEHLAYMIYTSGSTGRPKGVQIPHRAVLNFLHSMRQVPGLQGEDVLVALTTISFDIAALELFLPLCVGARVQLSSRQVAADGEQLITLLREAGATVVQATPATWRLLLASGWSGDSALKILCGGEALPLSLAHALLQRSGQVWNMYGPTETTIWSTCLRLEPEQDQMSIGTPIGNTQVYVLDTSLQPVPIGGLGEIFIGGKGVARGYVGEGDMTAEKFVPDPFGKEPGARLYRTGDRGRFRGDGRLECLGRLDQQVKLRGYRIEPGEIEAVLRRQEQVKDAVVMLRTRGEADSVLLAYVVPQAGTVVRRDQLQDMLRKSVPEYMVPTLFVSLEALPLTPNGKVDREALPLPEDRSEVGSAEQERSRTALEDLLASIWGELLQRSQIGVHEHFFEIGGHSLLATQLVARVRELLQIELPLRSLFEAPTIAQQARVVEQVLAGFHTLLAPPLVPVSREQPLPLSFAQQRLWFLDQLEPGNVTYTLYDGVCLQGPIMVEALQRSLQEIVKRHESLRTTFEEHQGEVLQIIDKPQEFRMPLCDLSALEQIEQQRAVQWLSQQAASVPFDLRKGPLLRGLLVRSSYQEYVLLLSTHHIVSDAWSVGVLVRELTTLYRAFVAGNPSPLAPLPLQYADFALWQRSWLRDEVVDMHIDYWRKQLRGATPLELPSDRPKGAIANSQGAVHSFALSAQLTEDLRALSHEEGVTPFMTLLATFQILLHRYTKQQDIVVGTDIANRTHAELEGIIGFFVNLLVLRTSLTPDDTFRKVLKSVRIMLLNAYAHQDLPFEKLVEALQLDRVERQVPLVNTLFVMQNTPSSTLAFEGITISPLNIENRTAKFDLAVFITESAQGFIGGVDYRTDLFDSSSIASLCDHFVVLLQSVVASSHVPIKSLEMRTEEEQVQQANEKISRQEAGLHKLKVAKRSALNRTDPELLGAD